MTLPPGLSGCEIERRASRKRLLQLTGWAALAGLLSLGAAFLYHMTRPVLGPETVIVPGGAPRAYDYPLRWRHAPVTRFILRQPLWLPARHTSVFVFYPQDILWAVAVNGHDVRAPGLPISVLNCEGRSIDLAPYLHAGENVLDLQMEVRWGDARFRMAVSPRDPCAMMTLALSVAATVASACFLAACFWVKLLQSEWLALLGGVGLRLLYFSATPYYVRSFDYWGHADYVDYVVQHFSLPTPGTSWESFQPPLYYTVLGSCTRLFLLFGLAGEERYVLWQGFSLLLSVGVLIAGYGIAYHLYRNNQKKRIYMMVALAVAPPLVFNAARISNDCLAALLAFIWLFLLVRFSQRMDKGIWLGLSVVLGLALLTKATALALVAVSVIYVMLKRRVELKSRLAFLAVLAAICGAMAGAYYLSRLFHAQAVGTYLVGNLESLNPRARISHVLEKSLIFNPFKVVRYPFDETWGPRNDRFLEVFFKTLLLGEWIKGEAYKWLARYTVVTALLLAPPFLAGVYRAVVRRPIGAEPLLLTFACVFFAQWLFLQIAPYLSTQDFRFSVILIVPLVFCLLEGIDFFPERAKGAMTFLLQLALLNHAIYLTSLALGD